MMGKKCGVHKIGMILLLIGGFNWLLVGLLQKDLFVLLGLGMDHMVARAVYILVGVSALAALMEKKCCGGCDCGQASCKECSMPAGEKKM